MQRRLRKISELSSELQLFFYAKHDDKRIATQMYLLFWKQVQSFPAIDQKASVLKRKGMQRKRKQEEHLLSEISKMQAINK